MPNFIVYIDLQIILGALFSSCPPIKHRPGADSIARRGRVGSMLHALCVGRLLGPCASLSSTGQKSSPWNEPRSM